MFGGVGMWELLFVFGIVLLLFGAKRLPEIGSSLGRGIREFKGSLREIESELKLPEESKRKSPGNGKGEEKHGGDDDEGEENGEPRRLTTSG
ncbi:MAG: twin-arginine translocase TatA/TatE family subunit [Gemmatimonadales bacterium]|nr:MAG: twin-arginine translocase TatA/TatE family subunit [Gemmatimonadales bacterium]